MERKGKDFAKTKSGKCSARKVAGKKKYPRKLFFTTNYKTLCVAVDKALSSE